MCSSPHILPKFAILDPETTYTLPAYQTAAGCCDIMSHLMERYFTQTEHVDFTDRLLEVNNRQLRSIGGDVLPNQVGLF